MLFQALSRPDRTKTQLAYAAQYLPESLLSIEAKSLIVFSRRKYMYKSQVEFALNEDKTHLAFDGDHRRIFRIVWLYNAIPTQLEWIKKPATHIMDVEFRVVKDIGQIVLLAF